MLTRQLAWATISVAMLLVLPVFGEDADGAEHQKCSVATLEGGFGVLEQGTVVGQLPGLPAPPLPMAIIAVDEYDGRGNLSGSYTASFGGVTVSGTLTGTYTVNPDCTYSDQITVTPSGASLYRTGSIAGERARQRISFIYVGSRPFVFDSPFVASGMAKATPPGGCSVKHIKGNWVGAGQTTYTVSQWGFTPPFQSNWTSVFIADGAGNYSGSGSINLMGMLLPLEFTATYTVNRDCTFSEVVSNNWGGGHSTGVVTGVGPDLEITVVFTDPGAVSVVTMSPM